jgi:uncharacterized cupredoxin-like copper-binding protein
LLLSLIFRPQRADLVAVRIGGSRPNISARHVRGVLGAALLLAGLGACGGQAPTAAGPHIGVKLEDFQLTTSAVTVAAGPVTFDVTNNGPSTHEFNVDRTDLAADKLPINSTGLQVQEDSPQLNRLGSVESAGLSTTHHLTLDLAPGTYVVYCNLEGHYLSGMHVQITVR